MQLYSMSNNVLYNYKQCCTVFLQHFVSVPYFTMCSVTKFLPCVICWFDSSVLELEQGTF